jgi:hypothetical protein
MRSRHGIGFVFSMFSAWIILLMTDILLALGGFKALHRFVQTRKVRRSFFVSSALDSFDVLEALRYAHLFALHKHRCLTYYAAGTCLLRMHGYAASLVLGVRHRPFYSHAWIEHAGRTIGLPNNLRGCVVVARF